MADDLTPTSRPTAGELPEPVLTERPGRAPAPPSRRSALYAHRFGLAYALLAVIVGLAVGGFIVLVGRATEPPGPAWSSWEPKGDGTQKIAEIAQHVSSQYELPNGASLVGVLAGSPNVQNVPIAHFAVAKDTSGRNYSILPADNSIEYQLCGFGPSCAIKSGQPTLQRGRLVHRQAVELALYTFKYTGVDKVIALLPPKRGKQPTSALFFRRDDFKPELSRPLQQTLPPRKVLTPADMNRIERARVARLTDSHFFTYSFQQAPDRTVVLVLNPLPI
jgi:hypothetical protein